MANLLKLSLTGAFVFILGLLIFGGIGCGGGEKTVIFENGNKYVGELANGVPNGQGTFTWASGEKYVGEWKDGMFHGKGTYTVQGVYEYSGEFKDDMYHGHGTLILKNVAKYEGEWRNDKWHGQGTLILAAGAKYEGEWQDGEKHGQGTYTYADGTIEKGRWDNGTFLGDMIISDTKTTSESELMLADLRGYFDVQKNYGRVELNDKEKAFVLYPDRGYIAEVILNMSDGNPVAMEEWQLFLDELQVHSAQVGQKLPGYCIIVANPFNLENHILLVENGIIVLNAVN